MPFLKILSRIGCAGSLNGDPALTTQVAENAYRMLDHHMPAKMLMSEANAREAGWSLGYLKN